MTDKSNSRFTFSYFWKIFLLVAFPIHVWDLLLILKDFQFVTERTEMWDGFGYAGYALLLALIESAIFAVIVWALSLLLPRKWSQIRSFTVIGSIYLVLGGASMVDQAANAFNEVRISRMYLYGLENFPTQTYALIAGAIVLAWAALLLLILKTKKGEGILNDLYERFILLSYLYLLLDIAGIVLVVIRNIPPHQ